MTSKTNKIQLKTSSVLKVPIDNYVKDFTFIVNGEEIQTSRIISDLLSRKISQLHNIDATIDHFTINTRERGDFSRVLKLAEFKEEKFSTNELPFIFEVIELLNPDTDNISNDFYLDFDLEREIENTRLTKDNVLDNLLKHEKHHSIYSQLIEREIEFASTHFFEIFSEFNENDQENKKENDQDENESNVYKMSQLSIDTILCILNHENLQMKTEDQLLKVINALYSTSNKYSILYEFVYFENVCKETIEEFISIYDMNDLTASTWARLSRRLLCSTEENGKENENRKRYKNVEKPQRAAFLKKNTPDAALNDDQDKTFDHSQNARDKYRPSPAYANKSSFYSASNYKAKQPAPQLKIGDRSRAMPPKISQPPPQITEAQTQNPQPNQNAPPSNQINHNDIASQLQEVIMQYAKEPVQQKLDNLNAFLTRYPQLDPQQQAIVLDYLNRNVPIITGKLEKVTSILQSPQLNQEQRTKYQNAANTLSAILKTLNYCIQFLQMLQQNNEQTQDEDTQQNIQQQQNAAQNEAPPSQDANNQEAKTEQGKDDQEHPSFIAFSGFKSFADAYKWKTKNNSSFIKANDGDDKNTIFKEGGANKSLHNPGWKNSNTKGIWKKDQTTTSWSDKDKNNSLS